MGFRLHGKGEYQAKPTCTVEIDFMENYAIKHETPVKMQNTKC